MKKVLDIVSYTYLPYVSGGQKSIALFLQNLGESSDLFVAGTKKNDTSSATTYQLLPILNNNPKSYFDLIGLLSIIKTIKNQSIKTVIIEHPYIGWMGIVIKLFCKIKLIIHTHNIEHLRFKSLGKIWWRIFSIYETSVLKFTDIVFCISQEDKEHIINAMGILETKCHVMPYGILQNSIPTDKALNKTKICESYNIDPKKPLILFNGLLSYAPNAEAVEFILLEILPKLKKSNFEFNLIIAGKGLSPELNELKNYKSDGIIYAGYVDDIDALFTAADIFINPVISGGGVKTKLIEALGMNCNCISTRSGSIGVDKTVCGEKLKISEDYNWDQFTEEIIKSSLTKSDIPNNFYRKYNWKCIADECVKYI